MTNPEFDEKLQQQIKALQKNKTPKKDLWFGIEQSISEATPAKTPISFIAAACTLLFLGAGFLLANATHTSPSSQYMATLAEQHQAQKNTLLIAYQDYKPLTQNWDLQMQELDVAEKMLLQAITDNPDNATLITMLKHVHSKQITFINRAYKPHIQQPTSI